MKHTSLWLALLHAGASNFAFASDGGQAVPVVTVQGSAAAHDARRDDTAARIVVGRDELARFGDASVTDVLKRQPGITIDANGAIAMRGLGKGYTQVLLNGDKLPAGMALGDIHPDLIERIEISRVQSADQRAEAIAGTVNIILRKAGRRSARSARLQGTRARGEPGTVLSLQMSEAAPGLSWELAGTANDTRQRVTLDSDISEADPQGRPTLARADRFDMPWRLRQLTLAPSATLKLDGGDTLALQGQLTRALVDKDGRGSSTSVLGPAAAIVRDTQVAAEQNTQGRLSVEWAHKLPAERGLNLKLNLAHFRRATDFRQQGYGSAGAFDLDDHTLSGIRERSARQSGRYTQRLFESHALVAGWDAERTTRWEERRQSLRRGTAAPQAIDFDFDALIERLAVYAQDEWTASERLALNLGVRAERIGLRTTAGLRRTDTLLAPTGQLLWKPAGSEGGQLRLGLSRTYKAPEPRSLIPRVFTSTNNSPIEPDFRGDPHLRPELALGLDGAFERHWGKHGMASLGGYLRRIDGVTTEALALEQGRWVTYPVNGGRARLRGLEFDTRLNLAGWLPQAPKIDLRLNLTRNWSSRDDLPGPDNRVAEQLRFSGTAGADYSPSARWSMGISYSYKRGGPVRVALNRHTLGGSRGELDAYLLRVLVPGLKLRVAVSNALADAELSGTRYRDGGGVRQARETRTMPATLRAALEWSR